MRQAELFIDERPVCPVVVADTWWGRARGIFWRRPIPQALVVIRGTRGIGVREPLDIAHLDEEGTVVETRVLKAWRTSRLCPRGNLLEAPHGSFERWGVRPGTRVSIVPH